MLRFYIQIFLAILLIGIGCSQKKTDSTNVVSISLEQKALNLFKDSLMFQKIYLKSLEKDEVQLFPYGIDSAWIDDGVFSGYRLFSDDLSKYSGSPEIDSLSFISAFDYFTDSAIVEIKSYNRYYTKHANDLAEIQLRLPNKIAIDKKEKFLKRNAEKELFIEVKKKLISSRTQMVEITILKNRKEHDFPIEFRFISYFDLNGDLLRWSFR